MIGVANHVLDCPCDVVDGTPNIQSSPCTYDDQIDKRQPQRSSQLADERVVLEFSDIHASSPPKCSRDRTKYSTKAKIDAEENVEVDHSVRPVASDTCGDANLKPEIELA